MKYVLTNEEMRSADEYTIQTLGVPSATLMERAGEALADEAEKLVPTGNILCVCGGGNNGGDGFVCARILKQRGREAEVLFLGEKMSEDCRLNAEKWQEVSGVTRTEFPENKKIALAVDCLFGTGFHGRLEGVYAQTVERLNEMKKLGMKILSADIPSGLDGKSGLAEGVAVQADVTLCIGEFKTGVLLNDGLDYAGQVLRKDIGIVLPKNTKNSYAFLSDLEYAAELLPARRRNSHKGTYGRAAIVAGSFAYTGAAYLSAAACLRSGVGYTTLFTPEELLPYYVWKQPEILLQPVCVGREFVFEKEKFEEVLSYDSIAYGMGMGISKEVAKGAAYLLKSYMGKLILDADALNSLAAYKKEEFARLFGEKKCELLLTPHVKEFSRLSGKTVAEILSDSVYAPIEFSEKYAVSVLLKNAATVITDGKRTAVNVSGNSGQAKGGSGDVLAGLIAGLCASGTSVFDGACLGAYIAGNAAEKATEEIGERALMATDVISYLGASFLDLEI